MGALSCALCGDPIEIDDATAYAEATGWVQRRRGAIGLRSALWRRRNTGRWAHGACLLIATADPEKVER